MSVGPPESAPVAFLGAIPVFGPDAVALAPNVTLLSTTNGNVSQYLSVDWFNVSGGTQLSVLDNGDPLVIDVINMRLPITNVADTLQPYGKNRVGAPQLGALSHRFAHVLLLIIIPLAVGWELSGWASGSVHRNVIRTLWRNCESHLLQPHESLFANGQLGVSGDRPEQWP